jgi:hypothetical protein
MPPLQVPILTMGETVECIPLRHRSKRLRKRLYPHTR